MKKLDELRKLAKSASKEDDDAMVELQFQGVKILAMCDLLEQMRDVMFILHSHNELYYGENHNTVILSKNALTAFDKWNNEPKG